MHISDLDIRPASSRDLPAEEYSHHSSAQRVNTEVTLYKTIKEQYPHQHIAITGEYGCDLLSYAAAGHALARPVTDATDNLPLKVRTYVPPANRLDGGVGGLVDTVLFGKYKYSWKEHEFVLYLVDGRDGSGRFPTTRSNYIIGDEVEVNQLILEVGNFTAILHNEIWVFDQGHWRKDAELWKSVSHASWDNVILEPEMKQALIEEVTRFFDSRATYAKLKVPWRRGIIFHGPPGESFSLEAGMWLLF